jgi:predicted PP-loop superfamily ATPase
VWWIERVYGRRKRYIKIHFAVDVRTKEIVAMNVTTDDIHDSKVLPELMIDASMNRLIAEAYMDGAYDSSSSYTILRWMGVKPIIKPRRNSRMDSDT